MRILGKEAENIVKVVDPFSDQSIRFIVDVPTTEMRAAFFSAAYTRTADKAEENTGVRRDFGAKVVKGFKGTPFAKVVDGKPVPISSDPASPQYDEGWKALVIECAPELLEAVANQVFLGLSATGEQEYTEKN